jgi:hypothetical protein
MEKQMDGKFRQVADFQFCGIQYAGVNGDSIWILGQAYMAAEPARRLRDWLNKALPCEHRVILNGFKRVDPFGKSDAMVEVKNECQECGVIVPAPTQASGGADAPND